MKKIGLSVYLFRVKEKRQGKEKNLNLNDIIDKMTDECELSLSDEEWQ